MGNLIKNQYVTNCSGILLMDTTHIGNKSVFLVQDMMSRAIVGFMLVERKKVTVSQICTLFESLLGQEGFFEPSSIIMVHGDSDILYLSEEFQDLLRDNGIQFSSTERKPHYNQTIKSAINILKTILCEEILSWGLEIPI